MKVLTTFYLPLALVASCCLAVGCRVQEGQQYDLIGQDVRLTILHTTDWHSRLLPYDMDVRITDENLGLNPDTGPYGGVARLAYLIKRERGNSGRSIYLDSGDPFQGAPIFNVFNGEVEFRAMSLLGVDAMVIGNHEFDAGADNLIEQAKNWANFPLLAANYHYVTPRDPQAPSLGDYTAPYSIINREGLVIGVIGVANLSSMTSIGFADNSLNIQPMDQIETTQYYINLLHPHVNLLIALSHAGLTEDHEIIEGTVGLDLVMGGHLHIVLDPPRKVHDASGREVILCHSGAFLKYLGRLDVILEGREDDPHDFEVVSHRYEIIPIDSLVPEDPDMLRMIEPYMVELRQQLDLTRVFGFAPRRMERYGLNGGDSPLGNFVADAIRTRRRVETDFAVNNTLGVRSDIVEGPIILDQTFNVFPFPNTITTMTLSGNEVQELLNYNAQRSAWRGCNTQLQVSGISFVNDCSVSPAVARDIRIHGEPIASNHFYTMATNDYIARGGSGFNVLRFNNTQQDTGITVRDAVNDAFLMQPSCLERCQQEGKEPDECPVLRYCTSYMTAYFAGFCQGFDPYSDQERCLDIYAPECLEFSDVSDFEICRTSIDRSCENLYHERDRQACYAAQEANCEQYDRESPRAACAYEQLAEGCLQYTSRSPSDICRDDARLNAEDLCLTIPCVESEADGRIQRILPSNEYVPVEEPENPDYQTGYLMEWIQDVMGDEESGW
ncbi:MAG: bifunctional metallophosphatase/5'-nucleotidase [Bradymonadales bacterium]|nr:bifunctional metallophosphatase/5'-nucleotidase [Bradymonadales bacterium]